MTRRGRRAAALLGQLVAALGALAGPAGASTATVDGRVLLVTGTPGVDQLTISRDSAGLPAAVIVRDGFTTTTAGAGCAASPLGWATCPLVEFDTVDVDLGDGGDVIIIRSPIPIAVHGGDGDDSLIADGASTASVTLDGGAGDDHLAGGPGDDILLGGAGDDGLDGGFGNDTVDPGAGRDSIADEAGDDAITAQDREPDYIDCGPGVDHGTFDAIDITHDCEGAPQSPARADCTPEIEPPTAAAARRLLRGEALRLRVATAAGCDLTATLLVGGARYARARTSRTSDAIALRPSAAGRRALRRHRIATVRVVVRAPGGHVVIRRVTVPLV